MKKAILLFIVLNGITLFVAAQGGQYVLMLSKSEHKMWVLDYKTLDTIAKIQVGEDPHEIALSADESTAYVSNAVIQGAGHVINIIDLKNLQPVDDIDTKPFFVPHGMVFRNDTLWFTAQGSKVVVAYGMKQKRPVQVLGTGQNFTHLLRFRPDGQTFYTSNVESGTISIYEHNQIPPYMPPTGVLPANAKPRLEWQQSLVNVGAGAEGFDITADGKELWTARPDGHIIIVDLVNKKIKADIDSHVQGLHRLAITPDGKTVCVVSVKTGDLLYYDRTSYILELKEKRGKGAGIYMDKGLNRMFVACTPDNYVYVIDLSTRKEIKKISIGRPDGINATTGNDSKASN